MAGASPGACVDVVVPCYNGASFLDACLFSLLAQTESSWRAVVVDDGSTDGSSARLAAWEARDERISVIRQSNAGPSAARNTGAGAGRSQFVLFLDVDDVLEPTMLHETVRYLDGHPEVGVVYTGHSYIDEQGRDLGVEGGAWPWTRVVPTRWGMRELPRSTPDTPFASIYLVAAVIPSLALVRRAALASAGPWDEDLRQVCEDTDLYLRLALVARIHFIDRTLVRYRRHAGQSTQGPGFEEAYARLHLKWSTLPLPREQRALVDAAEWFRARRFVPLRQVQEAQRELLAGRPDRCLRMLWQAVRRYSIAAPSGGGSTWWHRRR